MKTIRTMMILDMKQRVLLTIILLMVFCSYGSALIDGAGTKYDPNHIDGTYARIDGGSSKPGYLSPKVYDVWVVIRGNTSISTGLEAIDNGELTIDSSLPLYNLHGQRVSHPVKGQIYIQNGRKIRF